MQSNYTLVLGCILNPQSDKKCEIFKDGALLIKKNKVLAIGNAKKIIKELKEDEVTIVDYSGQVIMPSFFDMHFHWVQDDVRQMPKANLLQWLNNYTFPAENKFKNKKYSKDKARVFFKRLISTGTLGGACYSSIHEHALEDAQKEVLGDFVIGNVLMTINSPKFLTQTKKQAIDLVKKLSSKYKSKYALTPRFAIATDPETMLETSKIAKKNKSFMQTHLSETTNEIDFVLSIYRKMNGFEKVKSYTDIYKKTGMLGKRTIMGHGIHLSKEELLTLSNTKTAIAHCPTSNAPIRQKGLGSGLFNFKLVEKHNIRWALGSDIGGGPFLSMFDVIRSFVDQNEKAKVKGATYKKALYRATLAGAQILELDKTCGNLNTGKLANFIVLPKIQNINSLNVEQIMDRYINKGKNNRKKYDSLVEKVFYKGELVFSKE